MARDEEMYIGIDIGGTKMLAGLVDAGGTVHARERVATPRTDDASEVLKALCRVIETTLDDSGVTAKEVRGIGLAVPGVVAPKDGKIVATPNMSLSGMLIVPELETRFELPVYLGNDVNLGTLGEYCLGAAQGKGSAVGVFIGTGIGAGIVIDGRLIEGARDAAGEVGHMVMQVGGPLCGCGNRGCLEAVASRSAIERDIREAVAHGRSSIITELTGGDLRVIKSKVLKRALKQDDELVSDTIRKASETIGYACLTLRHILDPDVIILGGGVIEACSDFILPIVQQIVGLHSMPGARECAVIVPSRLGDDAVVIGAVALVRMHENPGEPRAGAFLFSPPEYGAVTLREDGVAVGDETFTTDMYIRASGKIKQRRMKRALKEHGSVLKLGEEELKKACKGGPEILYIGAGTDEPMELTEEGAAYLASCGIVYHVLPTPDAIDAYNGSDGRKALFVHL